MHSRLSSPVAQSSSGRDAPDDPCDPIERERAQLLLASQKRVLELLAGSASLEQVLEAIVCVIEGESDAGAGVICLFDADTHTIRRGAATRLPEDYWRAIESIAVHPEVGTCCAAVAQNAPVITTDIDTDPRWRNLKDLPLALGFRAAWATPIHGHDGGVLGAIGAYLREARPPTAHERFVVDVLERTAALAIERHAADRLLRESEERFRTLVDQTTAGVMQADRQGRMTLVNQRWCEMLGYSEAELLRMTIMDVTSPDDLALTLESVASLAAGGPNYEIEKRYRRKDGSILWATSSVNARRGPAGEYLGLVGVVVDITERKRAEGALQASEERLRAAVEAGAIGIFDIDFERDQGRFSPELCTMLGLPIGTEMTIEETFGLIDPRDLAAFTKDFNTARDPSGDGKLRTEMRILRADGTPIWIAVRGRCHFREKNGRRTPVRYIGTVIDITDRKQKDERLMLLMREVNHRAKNLLAVVQAVARLTAGEEDPRLFAEHLGQRIAGLAASHDLLVQSQWQGVEAGALVRSQLAHFRDLIGRRIRLSGPPARLKPAAAQGIGMALHELATNAGKYGALSDRRGRVDIVWGLEPDTDAADLLFHLSWREHDGPRMRRPHRTGFGHTVLVDMVEHELGASVRLDYAETGLAWELSAPAKAMLEFETLRLA